MYDPQNGAANREWSLSYSTRALIGKHRRLAIRPAGEQQQAQRLPANTMVPSELLCLPSSALDSARAVELTESGRKLPGSTNDPNDHVAATIAIEQFASHTRPGDLQGPAPAGEATSGNDGNSIYVLPQYLLATSTAFSSWRILEAVVTQGVYGGMFGKRLAATAEPRAPGTVDRGQSAFEPSPDAARLFARCSELQLERRQSGREIAGR